MRVNKYLRLLYSPTVIFVLFFIVYSLINLKPKPAGVTITSGDEPHYLVMTYSLVHDKDLDLLNNYKNSDYKPWFTEGKLDPHLLEFSGKAYAHHQVGLPVFLIPAFTLAGRIGAVLTLVFLTSIGLVNLFKILKLFTKESIAFITTFLVGLSVPVGIYSGLIYPEVAVFSLLSFSFLNILKPRFSLNLKNILIVFFATAFIPIFHLKFVPLVVLVVLFVNFIVYKKSSLKKIFIFSVVMFVPFILYIVWWMNYFDWQIVTAYGKLNKESTVLPTNIPSGLLAYLVDRENGVLIFSPFYIFVLQGFQVLYKNRVKLKRGFLLLLLSIIYILFFTMYRDIIGGQNPGGRFLLPIITGLAIALAMAIEKLTKYQKLIFIIMNFFSLAIFILFSINPSLSFPSPNYQSNLIFFIFKDQAPFIHTLLPNLSKFGRDITLGDCLKGLTIIILLVGLTTAESLFKKMKAVRL